MTLELIAMRSWHNELPEGIMRAIQACLSVVISSMTTNRRGAHVGAYGEVAFVVLACSAARTSVIMSHHDCNLNKKIYTYI